MAISKAKKAEKIQYLATELADSTTAIVGTFSKLTVSQDFALRTVVRNAGGKYRVLKNKLAERGAKGTKIEAALQGLKGVSSMAYTSGDPVALAKALTTWVKENAEFSFKLAIVDGKLLSVDEIQQLAAMPGREETLLEAVVPDQCSGAATGNGVECHEPRSGGGDWPGGRAEEVFRSSCVVRTAFSVIYQDLLHRAGVSSGHNGNQRGGNRDGQVEVPQAIQEFSFITRF